MRKKVATILGVWVFTGAWHLRYTRYRRGSPIPGGWGPNIDASRYFILQSGYISDFDAFTVISSYAGAQNYDLGATLLAILNIVMGANQLVPSLRSLVAVPFQGLLLFPVAFGVWYVSVSQIRDTGGGYGHVLLVLAVALAPAANIVLKTSETFHTETIATAILLYSVVAVPRLKESTPHRAVFVIFALFVVNLYHTWVFLYLLIIGTTLILSAVYERIQIDSTPHVKFLILAAVGVIFFLIGTHLNNRFIELTNNLGRLTIYQADTFYSSVNSPLIQSDVPTVLTNLNLRRVLKLANYGAAFSIVALFGVKKVYQIGGTESNLDRYDRTIFFALFSFPVIITGFYSLTNIGGAVGRTQYIGIYFVIFAGALLLHDGRELLRRVTTVLLVVMVLTAVPATVLSGGLQPQHTYQEEAAITTTGQTVPTDRYVFSDASLGPPLEYYRMKGIAIVTVNQPGWERTTRDIYFQNDSDAALTAIWNTVTYQRSESSPRPEGVYILLSGQSKSEGVPFLSFRTTPTRVDPRHKFSHNRRVSKMYTTGDVSLYQYRE